jgi:hypothetical protein
MKYAPKNKELILVPYLEVGLLEFGKLRTDIRAIMQQYDRKVETFKRDEFSVNDTDSYFNGELMLEYNESDTLCGIDFTDFPIFYGRRIISTFSFEELLELDKDHNIIADTLFLNSLGMIVAFDADDENRITSMLISDRAEFEELKGQYIEFENGIAEIGNDLPIK